MSIYIHDRYSTRVNLNCNLLTSYIYTYTYSTYIHTVYTKTIQTNQNRTWGPSMTTIAEAVPALSSTCTVTRSREPTYIHTYIHLSSPIQKTKIIDTYYAYVRAYIHTECLKQLLNLAFCNIRRKIRHLHCRLLHFSKSYIHTYIHTYIQTYLTYMHMKSTCRISSSMHTYTNTYIRTPPEFHS